MTNYTLRKNKHYTTITINSINRKTLVAAETEKQRLLDQDVVVVVKPSKRALEKYVEDYKPDVKMADTPAGHIFDIMGVCFKVIKKDEKMITIAQGKDTFMTPVGYNSLIEEVYNGVTGGLLYF